MFVICVIFSLFVVVTSSYDSCPESNSKTPAVNLRDSILCNYDYIARPVADHTKPVNVSFNMRIKYFTYDITTSTLSLETWLTLMWVDEHLKWNPAEYGNISFMHLHTSDIWTPDISIYNGANLGEDPLLVGYTKCIVTSKGTVSCVPPVHINALCVPSLSRYPFDEHLCTLNFGSWVHAGEEIDFRDPKNDTITKELTANDEWKFEVVRTRKLVSKYACCPKDTFPSIQYTFKIIRLAGAHTASLIIPTIVGMMLTLTVLWLSPMNKERVVLSYINIIVHILHLENISWQIPLKGNNVPLLIIFGRDSLLLSLCALIFTFVLRSMMQKKTKPPEYVSFVVVSLCKLERVQLALGNGYIREENDQEEIIKPETNSSNEWAMLGKALDILILIIFIIVYIIMMISFLP